MRITWRKAVDADDLLHHRLLLAGTRRGPTRRPAPGRALALPAQLLLGRRLLGRLLLLPAAFAAPCSSLAASFSRADSRSIASAYFAYSGEAFTACSIAPASAAPISDSGARSRVQATGVGAPRSFITVTIASPMPSERITWPRSSYAECG